MAVLSPATVYALVKEVRVAADEEGPLVVDGARGLADALRRELAEGARPGAVRAGPAPEGADVLVYVLAAAPGPDDERALKEARRRRVPVVAVLAGPALEPRVPYVLPTDVVRVPAASGFPLDEIARVVAARLGEEGTSLAARVPAVRAAVCENLVESFSRRHAALGAAVFMAGADFPAITLGQLRMVLRLAAAHGLEVDQQRLPEIVGVVAGGSAFRRLARRLLAGPLPGFLVRAAVAYAGTRAMGEAAVRFFGASVRSRS